MLTGRLLTLCHTYAPMERHERPSDLKSGRIEIREGGEEQ
jgi:hypothetical protein